MRKMKKILQEVHPLHIIREVQKWPALYAKDCPERSNAHFRHKIWCEVAKELLPDWDTFSKAEKENKITELSKKWRNLRDTFKRQVEVERKVRDGHHIRKKVYVYYRHMAFLLPHLDDEEPAPAAPAPAPAPRPGAKRARPDEPAPSTSAAVYVEDIDEDKHFVLSLIPSLKKMTEDEKLTVKVEILKAIKSVRSSSSGLGQAVDSLACDAVMEDVHIKKEVYLEVLEEQESNDDDSNSSKVKNEDFYTD